MPLAVAAACWGAVRRAQILDLLDACGRAGESAERIADELGMAVTGVRAHLRRMYREGDVIYRGRTNGRRWRSVDPPDPDESDHPP